ncbi:hypothetical protein THAOC_29552 [Thalassiosira oceanica]|uniref:Uncharacterized protein n=1 Tax=Thalassiosira oceanica TaxID=159749 RepID=K0RC55_THAOC|nr:hypothetical protein THAOC_29552 [Thalassiosira oceanica]|eukprot:EJK51293.1 hypothetical protein THAOC_29552 [Thalassiosira oceanica]
MLVTAMAHAHFGELRPCSPVQLLQTGAREALGHEFDNISEAATRQLVACWGNSPPHHKPVRVSSKCLKHVYHDANHRQKSALSEPVLSHLHEIVPNESQHQVSCKRSLTFVLQNFRKAQYRLKAKLNSISTETCGLAEQSFACDPVQERDRRAFARYLGRHREKVLARRNDVTAAVHDAVVVEHHRLPQQPMRRRNSSFESKQSSIADALRRLNNNGSKQTAMPSRKKARGRQNRAKKEAVRIADLRSLWEPMALSSRSDHEASSVRCEHTLTAPPEIPRKSTVVSFMNHMAGEGFFNRETSFSNEPVMKTCYSLSLRFPGVRKEDNERALAMALLLRFLRNVFVRDSAIEGESWFHEHHNNEVAICCMINLLEYRVHGDWSVTASRATAAGNKFVDGNRRDTVKFVAKRLPCTCLKELHRAARKKVGKGVPKGRLVSTQEKLQTGIVSFFRSSEDCSDPAYRKRFQISPTKPNMSGLMAERLSGPGCFVAAQAGCRRTTRGYAPLARERSGSCSRGERPPIEEDSEDGDEADVFDSSRSEHPECASDGEHDGDFVTVNMINISYEDTKTCALRVNSERDQ